MCQVDSQGGRWLALCRPFAMARRLGPALLRFLLVTGVEGSEVAEYDIATWRLSRRIVLPRFAVPFCFRPRDEVNGRCNGC